MMPSAIRGVKYFEMMVNIIFFSDDEIIYLGGPRKSTKVLELETEFSKLAWTQNKYPKINLYSYLLAIIR